jgi:hypothetical protein
MVFFNPAMVEKLRCLPGIICRLLDDRVFRQPVNLFPVPYGPSDSVDKGGLDV